MILISPFHIVDGEAPEIVRCVDDITQIIPLNAGGITVTWLEPIATDNSGTVTIASRSHAPGTFFNTGSTQVIYRFEDPSANSAICSFIVFVNEGMYTSGYLLTGNVDFI